MSRTDLTRWNRAGLDRFRYVDGNAPTHLEALRHELASRFDAWQAIADSALPEEPEHERTQRLIRQYNDPRREWAWAIARAFSRATHVISEHADAFANEGYLRTATQWQNVRRLAAMIGYTAKPASSAETPLVLLARETVDRARVERGFQVRFTPEDGTPPLIFETLKEIDVAHALNELRLDGWNKSTAPFSVAQAMAPVDKGSSPQWLLPDGTTVNVGGLGILSLGSGDRIPVRITELSEDRRHIAIEAANSDAPNVKLSGSRGTATLDVAGAGVFEPWLNGAGVVWLEKSHNLDEGAVVAWVETSGSTETTRFAEVVETGPRSVALKLASGANSLPPSDTRVYPAKEMTLAQFNANDNEWRLPLTADMARSDLFRLTFVDNSDTIAVGFESGDGDVFNDISRDDVSEEEPWGFTRVDSSRVDGAKALWFADPGKDKPAGRIKAAPTRLVFDGSPTGLKTGDNVIVETWSAGTRAARFSVAAIKRIDKPDGNTFEIELKPPPEDRVIALHGPFRASIRPTGADYNAKSVGTNKLRLAIKADAWPDLLALGRKLVLQSESGSFAAIPTTVGATDPERSEITLNLATKEIAHIEAGDLIIRGNVVTAGHGEIKPPRVLGSGDASRVRQRFSIDLADVSHTRDPLLPGGVRASVSIEADGQTYEQVATFHDSEPPDSAYVLRIDEGDKAEVIFGDGRHGRRLPSGLNNVVATLRQGAGLAGNLAPFSLSEIVHEHAAVESILQPVAATGGDDREPVEQIRTNAPARLTAMDRAISLADFRSLAEGFQGVWHAEPLPQPPGPGSIEKVRLVVVPAGGGTLGALAQELETFLGANAIPNVDIAVVDYRPIPLAGEIVVRVDPTQFDLERTRNAAREALLAAFDLRKRRPGQPLFQSEVIHALELTAGVANATVNLFPKGRHRKGWRRHSPNDGGPIWTVWPHDDQVIYAANPSLIAVMAEEAFI